MAKRDPTLNALVRDTWHLREEIVRRLMLNAAQRLRLEMILAQLDKDFEGQTFRDDKDLDDDDTTDPFD